MQRFLSRALEARSSCHCAICAPIRPGLARKVTTLPARQRIKFGDVVTIVYGTVLGTAAFYNGTSKKRKRKALNNAIAGVIEERDALLQDQEARLLALGYGDLKNEHYPDRGAMEYLQDGPQPYLLQSTRRPSLSRSSSPFARRYSTATMEKHMNRHDSNGDVLLIEDAWIGPRNDGRSWAKQEHIRSDAKSYSSMQSYIIPKGLGQDRVETEQLSKSQTDVQDEPRILGKTIKEAWREYTIIPSEKKLHIQERAISGLVLNLLQSYLLIARTKKNQNPSITIIAADGDPLEVRLDDLSDLRTTYARLQQRIKEMNTTKCSIPSQADDTTSIEALLQPNYQLYDRYEGVKSAYHEDIARKNRQLMDILVNKSSNADLISSICSFLIASTVGPNIHTMNLLLIHFMDLEWFQACGAVDTTIRELVTNSNEVTDLARLQLFHLTGQHSNLDGLRAIMLGQTEMSNRAAYIPGKYVPDTCSQSQIFTRDSTETEGGFIKHGLKAGWTIEAFSIIIVDLLERDDLSSALLEMNEMHATGLTETPEILQAFLEYSVFKQDWNMASKVWPQFEELGYRKTAMTWYWKLQACASCNKPKEFDEIVRLGKMDGALIKGIKYSIRDFHLSPSRYNILKERVHAIRRLEQRIHVPRTKHRDTKVRAGDIIQMENLEDTSLMVYLQYVELRAASCGRSSLGYKYLWSAQREYEFLLRRLRKLSRLPDKNDDIKLVSGLGRLQSLWARFSKRLEDVTANRIGSPIEILSPSLQAAMLRVAQPRERVRQEDEAGDEGKYTEEIPLDTSHPTGTFIASDKKAPRHDRAIKEQQRSLDIDSGYLIKNKSRLAGSNMATQPATFMIERLKGQSGLSPGKTRPAYWQNQMHKDQVLHDPRDQTKIEPQNRATTTSQQTSKVWSYETPASVQPVSDSKKFTEDFSFDHPATELAAAAAG